MPSKRILSWSKRQSGSEPYYRTGGLLPIDSIEIESCSDIDAKATLNVEKRRPSNLEIVPLDDQQCALSPITTQYSPGLLSVASGYLAFNDMLRSPVPTVVSCSRSASIQKPLPSRPRSTSVPSIAELPAELPGSLLLENGGYSSCTSPVPARPITHIFRSESHPPYKFLDYEKVSLDALNLASAPIAHARSVPELSSRFSATRTMCSSRAFEFNTLIQPDAPVIPQKHHSSELGFRRRSRRDLVKSPPPMEGVGSRKRSSRHGPNQMRREVKPVPQIKEEKVSDREVERRRRCRDEASSRLDPTKVHNQHTDKSRATFDIRNQAIASLQAELDNLKAASKAQVKDLIQSHLAEVASLKDQVRLLEERNSKQGFQKTPDSNYLSVQGTASLPRTPTRENFQSTASSPESLNSDTSFKSGLECQQRSPQRLRTSPEMENLKRRLSSTRRSETTARNLLPELNQYKQNNAALQKQIECLMAKLNESKKNERELRNTLGMTEMKCAELEDKAGYADNLAKTTQALQNTVDHLESRLEVANVKRIDAEEQLSNLKHHKSPFDLAQRELPTPPADLSDLDAHTSTSTVFSNTPSGALEIDYQDNSKLAALIAHVQRLQDQVSEKDSYITELEKDRERIKERHDHLKQEHNNIAIQSDIQDGLLQETRETDRHVEQLRAAVINRDAMIKENEQNTRALERQLEHHKLLLQAEIRRHAAMKVYIAEEEEPLPELTALARREDIDRWMEKLHERLRKERPKSEDRALPGIPDAQMESLRYEIDFYVREIILFKLDIKGYKSDIRKLKKLTAQMSSQGRPSDNDSEASSRRRSATPVQPHVAPGTSELDASNSTPPVVDDTTTASRPRDTNLPSRSASSRSSQSMAVISTTWPARDIQQQLGLEIPRLSWQLAPQNHCSNEADRIDSGIPPSPNAPLSTELQKPSCASNSIKKRSESTKKRSEFTQNGHVRLANTLLRPLHHGRSMSESSLDLYQAITLLDRSTAVAAHTPLKFELVMPTCHRRSAYISAVSERPPCSPSATSELLGGIESLSGQTAPTALVDDSCKEATQSPASISPVTPRARASSVVSTTSDYHAQSAPSPGRKSSNASARSISTATTSKHSAGLIAPFAAALPTGCSITRNAPPNIATPTSRSGIGGTMASSTPANPPVTQTRAPKKYPAPCPDSTQSTQSKTPVSASQSGLESGNEDLSKRLPRTPSHSRNRSGGSIQTAIRIPKHREGKKERPGGKTKDAISVPASFGNIFGVAAI